MTATLTIYDETMLGERSEALTLEFLTARISVRELIRRRVYEEVREINLLEEQKATGLVEPTLTEKLLNNSRPRESRMLERRVLGWEPQAEKALTAFTRNGFFILVDNRQVEGLDEEIELRVGTEVTFIKLVPLVGG